MYIFLETGDARAFYMLLLVLDFTYIDPLFHVDLLCLQRNMSYYYTESYENYIVIVIVLIFHCIQII